MNICAKVFEHGNFKGKSRWVLDEETSYGLLGFNDEVSSIIVYRTSKYQRELMTFCDQAAGDWGLRLKPGEHTKLRKTLGSGDRSISFNDKISSNFKSEPDRVLPNDDFPTLHLPLIVTVFEHAHYQGQYRRILESEPTLSSLDFNDKISSIKVEKGPDYEEGWLCSLFVHSNFEDERELLAPGNKPLLNYRNDKVSSIKIWKPVGK